MLLKQSQKLNILEVLEDFKALLPRYCAVKNDKELLKKFCSRNRNPIWDITGIKFFSTSLTSEAAKNQPLTALVSDHYIQRSKAIKFIFSELEKNPEMNLNEFIKLLKRFCSTVKLTKNEHSQVTKFAKKNPSYLNYETYLACGIQIEGLSDIIMEPITL